MISPTRPFAIVTGASSGIGFELAKCCAENEFDLLIAADEPQIHDAAKTLSASGVSVEAVQADLRHDRGRRPVVCRRPRKAR